MLARWIVGEAAVGNTAGYGPVPTELAASGELTLPPGVWAFTASAAKDKDTNLASCIVASEIEVVRVRVVTISRCLVFRRTEIGCSDEAQASYTHQPND
jgi:hypothetical protein